MTSPSVLDVVGTRMMAAVALTADRAILTGADPKGPPVSSGRRSDIPGPVSISALVDAAGAGVRRGRTATVAYIHPADFTAFRRRKTKTADRWSHRTTPPLLPRQSTASACGRQKVSRRAPPLCVTRVRSWSRFAVTHTVAVSQDAIFTQDGSICRVIARLDAGVNDPKGLVSIEAAAPLAAESQAPRGTRK